MTAKHLFRRAALLIVACLAAGGTMAQGVNLGVVVPEQTTNEVNTNVWKSLGTRLERMIAANDGTALNSGNIVLFPVLNFISDDLIEGGMRNVNSVEMELTVKCVSMNSNTTFGSTTWTLTGKGYGKSQAVQEAFNKLRVNDPQFTTFYKSVRPKVEQYYAKNRSSLVAKAKSLAAQDQYEEALALLYDYPQGASGYNEVQTTCSSIYKQYLKANCSKVIQQARAKFAVQEYEEAAAILSDVDATSGCASEAKTLSDQIRAQINSQQKAERQQELEKARISANVEKARVKAVSNIVTAYYKSRPRVNYNVVVHRW